MVETIGRSARTGVDPFESPARCPQGHRWLRRNEKSRLRGFLVLLAETEGFEPSIQV